MTKGKIQFVSYIFQKRGDSCSVDLIQAMVLYNLSSEEKDLILLRDELYGGSWQAMADDLQGRLDGKPYIFKLVRRIEEDILLIEKLQKIEKEEGINLAEHLD